MKNLELKEVPNGLEILEEGEPVGRVTKHSSDLFTWHSYQAKPPLDKGQCDREAGALANLGYRRKK